MLRVRVIPCLQLRDGALVKTVQFKKPTYIGDPVNTVRIFNELEVDELAFVDIEASRLSREPNWALLREITDECFMPLSYGGGITSLATAERLFGMGFEKVILNSATMTTPGLIEDIARVFGTQAVIAAIDVRTNWLGRTQTASYSGTRTGEMTPDRWAATLEAKGAGEILLTSIDREGTWRGFDVRLTASVTSAVRVPVIAHGGCGSLAHMAEVVQQGGASAVAVGSLVVYQGQGLGVLVNFPERDELARCFGGAA